MIELNNNVTSTLYTFFGFYKGLLAIDYRLGF